MYAQFESGQLGVIGHKVAHLQSQIRDIAGVIHPVAVQPADHHVGIAYRLDFFHAVFFAQLVKAGENSVEQSDHLFGRERLGQLREIHQVGKHHCHIRMAVRDQALMIFQPLRNAVWQHVEQHALGFFLLLGQQLMLLVELVLDLVHLHDKIAHQEINDGGHRGEIEREEHADGLYRHPAIASVTEEVIE